MKILKDWRRLYYSILCLTVNKRIEGGAVDDAIHFCFIVADTLNCMGRLSTMGVSFVLCCIGFIRDIFLLPYH